MAPKKPASERKERSVLVRLTSDQKALLTAAAKEVGLGLSGWMRSIALKEAAHGGRPELSNERP